MNKVDAIIINGVRYDSVLDSSIEICDHCDLKDQCTEVLTGFCVEFNSDPSHFKKSKSLKYENN